MLNEHTASTKFDLFLERYTKIYNNCFPKNNPKKNKSQNSKPWILPWLQSACNRKNKLYYIYIKQPTIQNKIIYQKLKKFTALHIKKAKNKYYTDYFERYSNDGRKQWSMINSLLHRRKTKQKIHKLTLNENTHLTTGKDIAEAFNNYFCNIATKLKAESPRPMLSQITNCPLSRIIPTMKTTICRSTEILQIIKSFKNKATSDTSIQVLKSVGNEIAPILSNIISASIEQGSFPSDLKTAKVIPLYKSGSKSDLANYRPISLLPTFSKNFERSMHNRLHQHFHKNNIIYSAQFGFRAGHSCEHALITAKNEIFSALDKKEVAVLLLIDFSKAFDMVDHKILLDKLEHYGVRFNHLEWFKSYLRNRKQYVSVNNTNSTTSHLLHGVPQGSILGPLLFIIYINDLPNINKLAKFILYADDANIIFRGKTLDEVGNKINEFIPLLLDWIGDNGLKLNVKKTKYLIFSNHTKYNLKININNTPIERNCSERFLGIILDENLNFNEHRSALSSRISRNSSIIQKLKGIVPTTVLKTLFHSFVQSHICYCPSIWGLGPKYTLNKIFSAQKKGIRGLGTGYVNYYYDKDTGEIPGHTKPIFNENKLMTVHNLILQHTLTTMHKIYRGFSPDEIRGIFPKADVYKAQRQNRSSATKTFFAIAHCRLTSHERTILDRGPKLYNTFVNKINQIIIIENDELTNKNHRALPLQNKYTNSFKAKIKEYLLNNQAEGSNDIWNDALNFPLYH